MRSLEAELHRARVDVTKHQRIAEVAHRAGLANGFLATRRDRASGNQGGGGSSGNGGDPSTPEHSFHSTRGPRAMKVPWGATAPIPRLEDFAAIVPATTGAATHAPVEASAGETSSSSRGLPTPAVRQNNGGHWTRAGWKSTAAASARSPRKEDKEARPVVGPSATSRFHTHHYGSLWVGYRPAQAPGTPSSSPPWK